MLRERVAEDIYVFTSEKYLQVTACAIITPKGAVVVDTLPFPQETREMKRFIEKRAPIHYVILTHHQPDHVYGAYLLGGQVIAHERCRRILQRDGERILKADIVQHPDLAEVQIRLPEVIFDRGEITLHIDKKTLTLLHTPGHTTDSISVYAREDKVLIAGDLVMPVPYIVGGDINEMRQSLALINGLSLENIVQGHGEVLLRGEIARTIETSLKYLDAVESKVMARIKKGAPPQALRRIHIESCHKSRIPLNGMTEQLHQANMQYLYHIFASHKPVEGEPSA